MGEVVQLLTPFVRAKARARDYVEQVATDAFGEGSKQVGIFMDICDNMLAEACNIPDVESVIKELIGNVLFTL